MPSPRLEPGVAASGQRLFVVGGFDQNVQQGLRVTRDVIMLDPFTGEWLSLQQAPVAWTHINLAASGSTLYILGGLEGPNFNARGEAFALDLDRPDAQWRELRTMPAGFERGAAGVVVAPPHIYLLGGASTSGAVATNLEYNLSMDTWVVLPSLPGPRSHPAATRMVDGTLIVAGGLATLDSTQPLADVWALPPMGTEWVQRMSTMSGARGGCAYGTIFGQLVCAGGEAGGTALTTVESYDPVNDRWTTLPDMPAPRAGTQGAVIGGRLYIPGGASALQFEPLSSVLVLSYFDALQAVSEL